MTEIRCCCESGMLIKVEWTYKRFLEEAFFRQYGKTEHHRYMDKMSDEVVMFHPVSDNKMKRSMIPSFQLRWHRDGNRPLQTQLICVCGVRFFNLYHGKGSFYK